MIVNQKKLEKLLSDLRDYYDKIFLCKPNIIKTVQKQKKTINANIERFIMKEYDSNPTALRNESQMQLLQETPRNLSNIYISCSNYIFILSSDARAIKYKNRFE